MEKSDRPNATASPALDEILGEHGLVLSPDQYLRWHEHSHHPRNWRWKRKCYDTALVTFLEMFIKQVRDEHSRGSGIVSSAPRVRLRAQQDSRLLRLHLYVRLFLPHLCGRKPDFCSINDSYLLGEGFGGVFLSLVSESFGHKPLYAAAALLNCVSRILVAAVPPQTVGSLALVIVARGAAGVVGSVPATVAPGSLVDMFESRERIWAVAAWTTASNGGVLVGPIYGSYVATYAGWR